MKNKLLTILVITSTINFSACTTIDSSANQEEPKTIVPVKQQEPKEVKVPVKAIVTVEQEGPIEFKEVLRLANAGDALAQYKLGLTYLIGDGVKKDLKKAVFWYKKAANQGYARAQVNLGVMYYHGIGVLKNPKLAAYWVKKAYDNDSPEAKAFWDKNELWKYL